MRFLFAALFVIVARFNLSTAQDACDPQKLMTCLGSEVIKSDPFIVFQPDEKALDGFCKDLTTASKCFGELGKDCDVLPFIPLLKNILSITTGSLCSPSDSRKTYLEGSKCLSTKQADLQTCSVNLGNNPLVALCEELKTTYPCVEKKSSDLCKEPGKKAMDVVLKPYKEHVKDYCEKKDPCDAMSFGMCVGDANKNFVVFETDETSLKTYCSKIKSVSLCLGNMIQQCKDHSMAIVSKSLLDTLQGSICVSGDTQKEYLDNAPCLSKITKVEYESCFPKVDATGKTMHEMAKISYCDSPKQSFPCITKMSEEKCEKKGKEAMQMMLGKYTEAFKVLCGDATMNAPKIILILFAAIWVFFNKNM